MPNIDVLSQCGVGFQIWTSGGCVCQPAERENSSEVEGRVRQWDRSGRACPPVDRSGVACPLVTII